MIENNRMLALFGSFSSITFEKVAKYSKIMEKYGMHLEGTADLPKINAVPSIITQEIYRPVLVSADQKKKIVFGLSRINIEESLQETETYDEFIKFVNFVLDFLFENENFSVNRLAVNGNFLTNDSTFIGNFKNEFFKENAFPDTSRWAFHQEYIKEIAKISHSVNIISDANYGLNMNIAKFDSVLIVTYDFNTVVSEEKTFSKDDIFPFFSEGGNFRKHLLKF